MSDTPRTDAACGWPWGQHGRIESSDLKCSPDGPFVHSSVARELERENAALRAGLATAEVGLKHALMMEPGDPFKRVKAITAALDSVRAARKESQP